MRCGARAALLGRRGDELQEAARLCGDAAQTEVLTIDLTKVDEIGPAVAGLVARVGRLYGLCHCAGVVQTLPLAATAPERLRSMMDVNLLPGWSSREP